MAIEAIQFRARVPVTNNDGATLKWCYQVTRFVLGVGKCGKNVTDLRVNYRAGWVDIIQTHDDGTFYEFAYKRSDVLGRIQIERRIYG